MIRGQTFAMLMISIGERPWAKYTKETFRSYCRKYECDFHFIDSRDQLQGLTLPDLAQGVGRKNKEIYAAKTFIAWKYMSELGYDRVAVVDDSCSVSTECPFIFDLVPYGMLGGTGTRTQHAEVSFEHIARFSQGRGILHADPEEYVNSGVLVYSRSMVGAITPNRVEEAADLLYNEFPHQTLTYYLIKNGGIKFFKLPSKFRLMPRLDLTDAERLKVSDLGWSELDDALIWAVSGAYRHRFLLASRIGNRHLYRWYRFEGRRYWAIMAYYGNSSSIWLTSKRLHIKGVFLRLYRGICRRVKVGLPGLNPNS